MTIHISLKLYASLSDYLPDDVEGNIVRIELDDSATPHQVIDRFRVPRQEAHLVLLNGVYIKPEDRDQSAFNDGDTLAIWPPVAGG
ncbi:molybdopterin converting factor small subunit [Methylohalomonas lacus]|uniref:Molybdopterin converting factor small subunit n=1 Tax=Methylohalomonas lacus TaxID=398773 RepID=A0AAE3HLE6_9GAMM|nr:MoaD/ThiS family protein [Methylohalomonas lacus]MCS3902567.1 molybdopterin converting factor small subunit [Methylohalomonas lacus]